MPNCSKCGRQMPFNPPNWVKLTEGHFRSYEIRNAILKNEIESEPYWALCPECYSELFLGLTKYVDRTTRNTISSKLENVVVAIADYWKEEPLNISAKNYNKSDICINSKNVRVGKFA